MRGDGLCTLLQGENNIKVVSWHSYVPFTVGHQTVAVMHFS